MHLVFENENDSKINFDPEQTAALVMEAAADYVKCPYEFEVNLLLTDDTEIQRVNREFRNLDKSTDVLSFPALEYEQAAEFSFLEDNTECFDPESGELILGDIMISMEHMKAQALEYGHSELREYAFLIAHSMLHLFGFDHMQPDEAADMERKQKEILDSVGIYRE